MVKKNGFTIRRKMLLSYSAIMLLLIATGLIGIFYVREVYNNGKAIYENDLKAVECLKSISQNIKEIDVYTFHMMVELQWNHDDKCEERIETLISDNVALMDTYSKLDISSQERELYNKGRASVIEFHQHITNIAAMADDLNEAEMLKLYQEDIEPIKKLTSDLIEEAVDMATARADITNADNQEIYNKIIWIICLVMIVAVVIAIVISYNMSNHIITKLKSIQLMAKRMSEYNISDDIGEVDNDEFGKALEALNESQFMIRELLEKIVGESAIISDMGEEVSLAVRKSEHRIEQVNVSILEYEKLANEVEAYVKQIVENRTLTEEEKAVLVNIREKLIEAKKIRDASRTELSSIATYLEQIGITSDYQNEIANSHKEQVQKFKIKEREE